MKSMLLRALLFLPLLCSIAAAQTLAESIESVLASAPSLRGIIAIHVTDLTTGAVLYERNAAIPMTPASNMKLFTTALALDRLGADYRFETRVIVPALPSPSGRVSSLRLVGAGDPSLSARAYPYKKGPIEGNPLAPLEDLADQVVRFGVRHISGPIIGDDTLYPFDPTPEGWTQDDTLWEYGAPVSALTLHDNSLLLRITPVPSQPVPTVTLTPATDYYTIHNTIAVAPDNPRRINIFRRPGSTVLELSGTMPPGGASTQSIALDDPALYAAETFRRLLIQRGVTVSGPARAAHRQAGTPYTAPEGAIIARRTSPPLIQILEVINKMSQNLHAELVLLETARVRRSEAERSLGMAELSDFLVSLGALDSSFDLHDGSGLSRRALVSAETISRLLAYMHASHGEAFRSTLPIAGADGTLATRFTGSPEAASIRAKTGTISHVTALSGYAGGRTAFSIISNHQTLPSSEVRAVVDKIALEILRRTGN